MAVRIADTLGTMGEGGYALVKAENVWLSDNTTIQAAITSLKTNLSNLFDVTTNIKYNTVDTYSELLAEDTTAFEDGVYIYIVKQDENYPKDDDEAYSTLYLWITTSETPSWNFIGKLNVSEKMMAEMITSTIATALANYYTKEEVDAKLAEIDITYELPTASSTTLGGVKVGENLSIDENGVLSSTDTKYSVATETEEGLMSAADKIKLNGLSNVSPYELPTASSTSLGGIKVGDNLTIDENGVLSATDTNTTYTDATTEASGLMSAADKTKLDGLENVEPYTLPAASSTSLGGIKIGANLTISDDGTLSATASEGGSSTLSTNITANTGVGGVASGDSFPAGTSLEDIVKNMLIKYIAAGCSTSINPSTSPLYKGVDTVSSVTITATVTKNSKPITSVKFYKGSTLLDTQTDVANGGTFTYKYEPETAIADTISFKAVANDGKQDTDGGTRTITFIYGSYFGTVADSVTTPSAADVTGLTKFKGTAKGYTANSINMSYGKILYAYPKSYGALSSIKDANNVQYINSYTRSEVTINGVAYYAYLLTDAAGVSSFTQVFA